MDKHADIRLPINQSCVGPTFRTGPELLNFVSPGRVPNTGRVRGIPYPGYDILHCFLVGAEKIRLKTLLKPEILPN